MSKLMHMSPIVREMRTAKLPKFGTLYASYMRGTFTSATITFDLNTLKQVILDPDSDYLIREGYFRWHVIMLVYGYNEDGDPTFSQSSVVISDAVKQEDIALFCFDEHKKLLEEIPLDSRCNVAWIGLPLGQELTDYELLQLTEEFQLWEAPRYGEVEQR